jgi:gliding motility-associated-like protein
VVNGFGTINKVEIFWDYINDLSNKTTDNAPIANGSYSHTYPSFGTPLTKTYRVLLRSTSGTGCAKDTFTDIIVHAAPQAQLVDFTPVCQEQPAVLLTQGSDFFNLPGIGIYSGTGILVSPVFVPNTAGAGTHLIRYTFTALNGCSSYAEKPIIVNPTPVVNLGPDRKVIEGDILTITPVTLTGNGLSYLWSPATFFTNNTVSANAVVKPTADITYTLKVTSIDGCVAADDVFVKVVKDFIVPNTFTPNNDGINDTWIIQYLDLYPSQRIQVFNRLGQLVFESKNYSKPWDGRYNGKALPTDTYYYIIDLGGARKTKTGYVTIVR